MTSINIWPILVASVVAFGIGALWYSPVLFGREWMALLKMTEADVAKAKAKGGMWWLYVIQLVFTVVTFFVMAFAISATGSVTASDGAIIGLLAWLGFVVPIGVSSLLWEKRSMKLVLINTICILLNLLIGGAIIATWG